MLTERARDHFERLGWSVESSIETWPAGVAGPSFFLRRGATLRAVLVSADSIGAYGIGRFAVDCKRARVKGMVICPLEDGLLEAAEDRGVEWVSPEGLGEPTVVTRTRAMPAPPVLAPATGSVTAAALEEADVAVRPLSWAWWRTLLVILVWIAAIAAGVRWLQLYG